jgi:hypothetical protein
MSMPVFFSQLLPQNGQRDGLFCGCKFVKNMRKYFMWSCCLVEDFHIQISFVLIPIWGDFVGVAP